VLKDRVMQRGEEGEGEVRKEILKEERAKRGGRGETDKDRKEGENLKEVMVKIGLK